MWVEFVVGSLLCSERFFSGYSGFPLSSKTNISEFQFDLDYCQALYHEPLARVIAQALPVFDVKFTFTFLHLLVTTFVACVDTQVSFDQDWANNSITSFGWCKNATSAGVIAYKLLSQNDSSDKIDSSKVGTDGWILIYGQGVLVIIQIFKISKKNSRPFYYCRDAIFGKLPFQNFFCPRRVFPFRKRRFSKTLF